MFYDDDEDVVERPTTGKRREEEGNVNYSPNSSRPGTASRDARANRANQLAAKRKERSSIGMVVASENMPRPSTAVGSRPGTPETRTSSTSNLMSIPDSPILPSHLAHSHTPPQHTNSTTNLLNSSPQSSPHMSVRTLGDGFPRPPTAMATEEPKQLSESEKELLKRGIAPTFDPNSSKPLRPTLDLSDIKSFITRPPPKGGMVQCKITRDKGGLLHPNYQLCLEENNAFLLAARKRKKSKSANYIISLDKEDKKKGGPNYMGKLRSNFVGTEFVIYDNGISPKELKQQGDSNTGALRQELGAVCYGSNVLGMKGPRKMTVLIPALRGDGTTAQWRPVSSSDSIVSHFQKDDYTNLVALQNKAPVWNEETRSYVLNFHNRVKQASVKNFQLVHPDDRVSSALKQQFTTNIPSADYIILQFGRVTEDLFTMDFQYPITLLQAFAIALSSFDNKLACE